MKNLDTRMGRFEKSLFKFHVETRTEAWYYWPKNTPLTYSKELVDTHNSMDPLSGTFVAPFSGTFGFMFYTHLQVAREDRYLFAVHNGNYITISYSWHSYEDANSHNIYFALKMNQGDTLQINSGRASIHIGNFPSKFMGFLLQN